MGIVNEKYADIVAAGKMLFWKFGIKKITIEDICKKAGTSRVTFYKYFPNKEALALHIIKELTEESFEEYDLIMNSEDSFKTKVEKTIQLKLKRTDEISNELLNDIYGGEFKSLYNLLEESLQRSLTKIEQDFKTAQEKGEIRSDMKIEFMLHLLNHMMTLSTDPLMEKMFPNPVDLIGEILQFFFYGVMPR